MKSSSNVSPIFFRTVFYRIVDQDHVMSKDDYVFVIYHPRNFHPAHICDKITEHGTLHVLEGYSNNYSH
jgi:precorrin-6B methylase 1